MKLVKYSNDLGEWWKSLNISRKIKWGGVWMGGCNHSLTLSKVIRLKNVNKSEIESKEIRFYFYPVINGDILDGNIVPYLRLSGSWYCITANPKYSHTFDALGGYDAPPDFPQYYQDSSYNLRFLEKIGVNTEKIMQALNELDSRNKKPFYIIREKYFDEVRYFISGRKPHGNEEELIATCDRWLKAVKILNKYNGRNDIL